MSKRLDKIPNTCSMLESIEDRINEIRGILGEAVSGLIEYEIEAIWKEAVLMRDTAADLRDTAADIAQDKNGRIEELEKEVQELEYEVAELEEAYNE